MIALRAQVGAAAILGGGVVVIGLLKVGVGDTARASPFLSMGAAVLALGAVARLWLRAVRGGGAEGAPLVPVTAGRFRRGWPGLDAEGRQQD